jgi:eukaryotic-like serine/threonine-protein kinase
VSSDEKRDPLLGRTIAGRFLILEPLRAGSMGTIYRARHVVLEKTVCIKVMHPELAAEPQFAGCFHREAKAASRLDHESSLRVIDYGQEPDGVLYIAMEFLDGRDLLAVLEEDWPLSAERVVDILSQTLSALGAAHRAGVLHRDLKPENIMVVPTSSDDGTLEELVKVCDFGIAQITEPAPRSGAPVRRPRRLTAEAFILGTPEYMSPEQARGDALDARSDLYSIGVLLYQMLTGRLPFDGDTALGVALKQINDKPRPPSEITPGVNPRLEAVCLRALEKTPRKRYASAQAMRAAMRAALVARAPEAERSPSTSASTTPTALPQPLFQTTRTRTLASERRPSPRRRAAVAIGTLMAVATLAIASAGWVAQRAAHDGATSSLRSLPPLPTLSPAGNLALPQP